MRKILILGGALIGLALIVGVITGRVGWLNALLPQSATEVPVDQLPEESKQVLVEFPKTEQERKFLVIVVDTIEMPLLKGLQRTTPENPDPFTRAWRLKEIRQDLANGNRRLDNYWMYDTTALLNMLQEYVETGKGTKQERQLAFSMYEQLYRQLLDFSERLKPKSFTAMVPTYGYQAIQIIPWELENFLEPQDLEPMIAITEKQKKAGPRRSAAPREMNPSTGALPQR